ncbi:MAG TPA: hypothetical protein VKR52_10300 [Terracidiphilus sp.]|nr:hypothetical protein [Terracidiphilus sp.]
MRLEADGIAVRLNLLGQPGEQPDFVVAAWVLPYVYALRGDRDWRRNPQLTGSRAVSQLAVLAYKLLEAGDLSIPQLKHALGREVSEAAVLRAITELWQQLRIIPVIAAPGQTAKWQLLRVRYQKAIAEGASTSQVTAISVLASIYLQAVIAASMEEVEIFLAPLTARSKVREVLRGLLATRQVHTIALGHAPHFYVAGTLPEFAPPTTIYAGTFTSTTSYFSPVREYQPAPPAPSVQAAPPPAPKQESLPSIRAEVPAPRPAIRKPAPKPAARPHFSRDRKSASARHGQNGRNAETRSRSNRPGSGARWAQNGAKRVQGKGNGNHASASGNGSRMNGSSNGKAKLRNGSGGWGKSTAARHNGHSSGLKAAAKSGSAKRVIGRSRADARPVRKDRKPAFTAGTVARSKQYRFTARTKQGKKKRG